MANSTSLLFIKNLVAMADIERYISNNSSYESKAALDPNVVQTVQDQKDAKELAERTGYKQEMKRRVTMSPLLLSHRPQAAVLG